MNFRSSLIIIVDATTSVLALWLGVSIKNESWFIVPFSALPLFILAAIALVFFFWLFGIYAEINKQLQVRQILQISKALALYALVFAALCILLYPTGVPRTVGVMQPILALVGVVGVRVLRSTWYEYVESRVDSSVKKTKVFIYGAGSAGRLLSSSLKHTQFFVEAFLDDDEKKIGRTLEGYLVRDGKGLDPAEKTNISTILLAMPTLTGEQRSNLFDRLDSLGYRMVTVPRLVDLASGAKPIADIRPLALEDLLEREPVKPNPMLLEKNVKGLCVLVTGAGGSIGSELCRQIIRLKPSSLVLVDHSEFMLFQIDQELRQMMLAKSDEKPPVEIFSALASTSDSGEMDAIFSKHPVSTVFHAAAYKHVHLLEENIRQGMRNNIVGTMEVIRCSEKYRVDNVVLVSTDKAVRPSSVMGLSKRVAELVIQNAAALSSHALYSIVRFGNVLGSNGSVIPIFRDQISKGGPVTVTDPEVTRYFMTIPEAASLVIQASALAKGGDVFVLEMGEPVKIVSVAERLVKLAGYTPTYGRPETQDQIEIQFVGLKAGEKMHEELTLTDERYPTLHPKVFRVEEPTVASETLERALNPLLVETDYNAEQLKARMLSLVSDVAFVE